jgi:hypothetical protein
LEVRSISIQGNDNVNKILANEKQPYTFILKNTSKPILSNPKRINIEAQYTYNHCQDLSNVRHDDFKKKKSCKEHVNHHLDILSNTWYAWKNRHMKKS